MLFDIAKVIIIWDICKYFVLNLRKSYEKKTSTATTAVLEIREKAQTTKKNIYDESYKSSPVPSVRPTLTTAVPIYETVLDV